MDIVFQLEPYTTFTLVAEEILGNLYRSCQITGPDIDCTVINDAKEELVKLIMQHNFDIDNVTKQIENSGWNPERINHFVLMLKERRTDVLNCLITHHNRSFGDTLVDFDWKLKLVVGSSDSKVLKYPLLQVIFSSVNASGAQRQQLFELNKETVGKLISGLEEHLQTY